MTSSEFINTESASFEPGQMIIVSGSDLAAIYVMLIATRNAIVARSVPCLDPVDTQTVLRYSTDTEDRGINFEFMSISNPDKVMLVGNEFDRTSVFENIDEAGRAETISKARLDIDVMLDLIRHMNVQSIPSTADIRYGDVRQVFAYISKVYYYDAENDSVLFIKDQIPFRP